MNTSSLHEQIKKIVATKSQELMKMSECSWKENSYKDGVKISTCMTDKHSCLKAHVMMKNTSVEEIWEMVMASKTTKKCMPRVEDSELIEQVDSKTVIKRTKFTPFEGSSHKRDVVFVMSRVDMGTKTLIVEASIDHPSVPVKPDHIRMDIVVGGFVLVPSPTQEMVEVTYYNSINFNEKLSTEHRMEIMMEIGSSIEKLQKMMM